MGNKNKQLRHLCLLALSVSLLASCGSEDEGQASSPLRPVRYIEVLLAAPDVVRSFSGVAEAGVESELSFKVEGTLESLAVGVGDAVKKGQIVSTLDDKDYRLRVQEVEASLEQAKASLRNALANYERIRALYENRSVSLTELDASRAAFESARAAEKAAINQLELAKLQLEYTRLQAPADCLVAESRVEVSENVNSGQPILLLNCGQQPKVKVSIPEAYITYVKKGQPVTITFDAVKDQFFKAEVFEVGVATEALTTTYAVTLLVQGNAEKIRSGMTAEVSFQASLANIKLEKRIIVPAVAVVKDKGGSFVFVVEPKGDNRGIVSKRLVTIGSITSSGIDIGSGLADKELVVTAGVSRLVDGQEVILRKQ